MARPHRLVFTWTTRDSLPDTSRVVVEIAPSGSGSQLTLIHEMDPKWAGFADRVQNGWTKMLDALAALG